MKKIFLVPAMALSFTACKNHSITDSAALNAGMQTIQSKQQPKVVYKDRVVYTNSSSHTAEVRKRGMSNTAKYAIIGGVGGAVIGGVATKSAKGAVIGGVVGAGTGYILGRKRDRKTGRIH